MKTCAYCGEQIVLIEETPGTPRWYHQTPADPRDWYPYCRVAEATPEEGPPDEPKVEEIEVAGEAARGGGTAPSPEASPEVEEAISPPDMGEPVDLAAVIAAHNIAEGRVDPTETDDQP